MSHVPDMAFVFMLQIHLGHGRLGGMLHDISTQCVLRRGNSKQICLLRREKQFHDS